MKILKSVIENIKEDAAVKEVVRGMNWTTIISKHCGLASSMISDSCHNSAKNNSDIGSLTAKTAKELAGYCFSEDPSLASLGMAAVNSVTRPEISKCSDVNGISLVQKISENKRVTVIGHFPGLEKIQEKAGLFRIIEKRPQEGDFSEESTKEIVPETDIMIISSTTLLNHTLESILGFCRKDCIKMLLGPSTPMTEVLFEYGIDILSGSTVEKPDIVLKYIKEGANFRQIKKSGGIRFVTLLKDKHMLHR